MYKVLYFNNGEGENAANYSVAYPVSSLRGFACIDATSLALYFTTMQDTTQDTTADAHDLVNLTIISGTHRVIIKAITDEIAFGDQAFITIGNKDDEVWLKKGMTAVAFTISS